MTTGDSDYAAAFWLYLKGGGGFRPRACDYGISDRYARAIEAQCNIEYLRTGHSGKGGVPPLPGTKVPDLKVAVDANALAKGNQVVIHQLQLGGDVEGNDMVNLKVGGSAATPAPTLPE